MIRAVFVLGAAAAEPMRSRGRGAIINVGSVSGETSMNAYSAIKAWVNTYSEVLANELHGSGVTVTDLEPGWVRTQFHQRAELRSSSIPGFLWLDADYLVERCLRDADRGRVVSIPSVRFKVLTWFTRHLPSATMRAVSRRIALRRRDTVSQ
jgi:short-subunit dehydrogenase